MAKVILIVEDEEDIINLLTLTLNTLDEVKILHAIDGSTALKILKIHVPNIVILDIQLPKSNGYDLCKSIKMNPIMSQTKVVILSGMSQKNDIKKAIEMGADEYIIKPFDLNSLLKTIDTLLNISQS